ncbi:Transcriptional regulatory protein moc3 [Verticillium dahliae VDG1]|nr:Transcriptional regulatory protein moc3 [Verticillium dahliae VDG1]
MSRDSNTSRRRDSAVEKSKYRSDSRAEMQKTFAEWTARLEDSERKEKKLSAKLQLQAALMSGKCDTIERKEAEVAAMRERIEVGKRQLIKCGRERDSIAADYDQLHADTQDLQQKYKQVQAEVKEMQCKKAQADEEVQRLKNEIEEHKSRYGKMATRLADYKMRFNEALDEQQRFYRHQKAFVDRAILDAEEMKRKSHDESERAIARGELVRDDLSKALEACRAFSRRESDTVNATLRDIEAKLQDTQQQLLQEVERSNNLETVSSRDQELQRRDEMINGLTAALKGHFDELGAALRTTNTSQVDLRHSMTQFQESIQNQLSTQLEGHCFREADMRQELIEMAEEKTQCATLLDVRYRQLKEVELSHEKKTEEAQGLRLQIASLESTANQEATMADDIAELRQALSNKDAQSTILQQQIQDLNVTHQNEIALLKKNMELEISRLQEEANVKTLKICDMESQLRDQAEMRQKDTEDIKESLANIHESLQQKREEPLRSIVSDTIDAAMQTEYRGTTNSGCDVVFEDTIVVRSDVRNEQHASPRHVPTLEQDATAETARLRRDLVDAEQRIANLTHRLKSPSQSPMDNNALNRLKQTNNELLVAKQQLRILEERAVDVEGMNEQFQTMLAIQRVLYHTHQSCLAETEAAETRMSNTVGPAPVRQFDLESVSLEHSKPRGDEQNSSQHDHDNDVSPTAVVVQLREKRIVLRTPSQSEACEALQKVSNDEERTQRRVMGPTKSILRRRPTTDSKVFEPISGGPFKFTPAIRKSGLPSGLRAYDQPVVGHVKTFDHVADNRAMTRSLQSSAMGHHARFRESGLLSPIERQRRELQAPGPSLQAIKGKRPGQFESVTESKRPRVDDDIEDVTEAEEVSRHFSTKPGSSGATAGPKLCPAEQRDRPRKVTKTYSKLNPVKETMAVS